MNKYLVITVDTEADWFHLKTNQLQNIKSIPYFQDVCYKYGFIPTYFITYEVATHQESIKILKPYSDKSLCEIGHHMHIWSCPPFESPNKYAVDEHWIPGIQSEISDDIFKAKMIQLHLEIEKNFGKTPTSHRAGRWAIDLRTLKWLDKHNYLVDSSVCNNKSWNITTKGINQHIVTDTFFSPDTPYHPSKESLISKDSPTFKLLEVPVTAINHPYFNRSHSKTGAYLSALDSKFGLFKFGNSSFRPSYPVSLKRFEKSVRTVFERNKPVVNFMLHSSELCEGTSPYSKNKQLHQQLMKRIELVLKLAKEYGLKAAPISQIPSNI